SGGFGLSITGGSLGLALLEAPTGPQYWVAVVGSGLSGSLRFGPQVSAAVSNLSIVVNQAGGGASALDWSNLGVTVDPGALLTPPISLKVTANAPKLSFSGSLTSLNVFNVIQGSASFALSESQVDVQPTPTTTLNGATLLTLALSNLSAS